MRKGESQVASSVVALRPPLPPASKLATPRCRQNLSTRPRQPGNESFSWMSLSLEDVEMAKAKKGKKEDQRGGDNSNTEAVVKHQKLCLSIDMENRRIYGYTELRIVIPDNGIVGLHADNLAIEKVTVDGDPAEFEVFPHYQYLDPKDRWCVVSSATSAADASGSVYLSSLEIDLLPNLLIMCSKTSKTDDKQEESMQMDDGEPLSADVSREVQNVKNVRIEYWVEKTGTGIHFSDNVLHTDNQLRRARCWFPCLDDNSQCCCYDLEFTVDSNFVAVSSGTLLHQVLTKDDPPRKTYVYKLDVPVAAHWIALAVAPFEILPDRHGGLLSHFCLPPNLSKLRNTMVFFHNAFSHYEDYLSSSFPFGSYMQVFLAPEMTLSSWSLGSSISIFSSHLLFDEKIIDQNIETRIRLAYALARQWFGVYITPEAPTDEWLLDGLAGFLTDSYIKRFLGNNEARYRRYKSNCAVCQADDSGATALSSELACKDLYGTQCIGFYGKIRSWKSIAVLQMLEKQMGPESFRKILQNIVLRARDPNRSLRTLSTKEFRHFANKIGNLERPFLKEFFPRWVGSCGCPVLKMGFSYNKRKNMVELAALRGCTSRPDSWVGVDNINPDSENPEGGVGWPGMMSIRVHELDGMYDHPILPMAGEPWQLLEIQCHSKLAAKRFQKPKKGFKNDGSDDNGDAVVTTDVRVNSESPLLWLRADPEMEYLAEIHFNQPVQMWINQLERDKDVVAQAQAIAVLEALPQHSFSVVNALINFLSDSKAFWRVRIQAAYALATTTSEDTDWTGLFHLINFYKSRRFDPNIGLPRPNDFHDFQEYFVLEAIPHAVSMVRSTDKKSPREGVEFILQLLKYNDNSGNAYSDVFWVAALVQSVGELEFGQQSITYLPSLLKRLDRLLQFDRLMPSHNGILTISCIQSLTQMALKLSEFIPLVRQTKLGICALRLSQMSNQSDCDSEVTSDTLVTLLRLLESPLAFNNVTLRHYIFCILQVLARRSPTLYGVPRDETLRMGHLKTCSELKNIFAALINQSKAPAEPSCPPDLPHNLLVPENYSEMNTNPENHDSTYAVTTTPAPDVSVVPPAQHPADDMPLIIHAQQSPHAPPEETPVQNNNPVIYSTEEIQNITPEKPVNQITDSFQDASIDPQPPPKADDPLLPLHQEIGPVFSDNAPKNLATEKPANEPEKKPKLKIIRVKQSGPTVRPLEGPESSRAMNAQSGGPHEADLGPSSSVSVDAPHNNTNVNNNNQNLEDVNSCQDVGSRVTAASIGSAAKPAADGEEQLVRELQCTADSSKIDPCPQTSAYDDGKREKRDKEKKKKDKEKKRKRNGHDEDPERIERKRLKKEKKRKEKELAKLLAAKPGASVPPVAELPGGERGVAGAGQEETKSTVPEPAASPSREMGKADVVLNEPSKSDVAVEKNGGDVNKQTSGPLNSVVNKVDGEVNANLNLNLNLNLNQNPNPNPPSAPSHKIKIKFKNRTLGFGFHPTEDGLVSFYLQHKLNNIKPEINNIIPVLDIYDHHPSDLPKFGGDYIPEDGEQWFFFNPRPKREARGGRPNRLTAQGYWKATGCPGDVYSSQNNRVIGRKRSMVFYVGRAPYGKKTMWKMIEYKSVRAAAPSSSSSSSSAAPQVPHL
ncbi:transcription initiation factor TFIID subunit 2 [Striga asiatica]|uniref:Transcription initiation factor TFIID subunit 2 n=1 Tax=Striga asiatica TaxID=4170 RepID=A0A5A7P8F3_STRAF|nr:transcription initiation factor TFIID subunit 2 [Striga asiatica]